jgi:hypothetical protein
MDYYVQRRLTLADLDLVEEKKSSDEYLCTYFQHPLPKPVLSYRLLGRIDIFLVTTYNKCLYASPQKPDNWLWMNGLPYTTSLTVCSTSPKDANKKKRHSWNAHEKDIFLKAIKELLRRNPPISIDFS